jgi:hypothetical protein
LAKITSLTDLLTLNPTQLEKVDIGLMNLLCAQGLKGAEDIDIAEYLARLDEWADVVRRDTSNRIDFFYQHPAEYDNSESMYKLVHLVFALKHFYGIHYNLDNMKTVDYSDSSQIFIHGLLGPNRDGSCVSIPVLYAAVAHRLGYPVRLVPTAQHIFLRWQDPVTGERFNVEPSTKGCSTPPDEHYKEFPRKLTGLQLKAGPYLKSMSAPDALSFFLETRGYSLTDIGRTNEALVAFAHAYRLSPKYSSHLAPLAAAVDKKLKRHWRADCKTMKSNTVVYSSYSGFDIDPEELIWRYPPLPPIETLRRTAQEYGVQPKDVLWIQYCRTNAPAELARLRAGLPSLPAPDYLLDPLTLLQQSQTPQHQPIGPPGAAQPNPMDIIQQGVDRIHGPRQNTRNRTIRR